jgi:hypothetical protein
LRGSPFAVRVAVQGALGCSPFATGPDRRGRRGHAGRVPRYGCVRAVSCAPFTAGRSGTAAGLALFPEADTCRRRGFLGRDRKRCRTSRYSARAEPFLPSPQGGQEVRVKGATPPCGGRGGKAPCLSHARRRRVRGERDESRAWERPAVSCCGWTCALAVRVLRRGRGAA